MLKRELSFPRAIYFHKVSNADRLYTLPTPREPVIVRMSKTLATNINYETLQEETSVTQSEGYNNCICVSREDLARVRDNINLRIKALSGLEEHVDPSGDFDCNKESEEEREK